MLKASATFYALIVSLIIGVTVSGLIILSFFVTGQLEAMQRKERLIDNAESGINVLLAREFEQPVYIGSTDLFGLGRDSVKLLSRNWGVYRLLSSTAFQKDSYFQKVALVGSFVNEDKVNFFLSDHKSMLSLAGNCRIEGIVALPQTGVKAMFIDNRYYNGEKLVFGTIESSKASLPFNTENLYREVQAHFSKGVYRNDTVADFSKRGSSFIKREFRRSTLVYYSKSELLLDNIQIEGNVIIRSDEKITVKSGAILNNVLIIAPSIEIAENFQGVLHAYANTEFILQKGVRLSYPSSVIFIDENNPTGEKKQVVFEESSVFEGNFMLLRKANERKSSICYLKKGATLSGFMYVGTIADIQGKVSGVLYADEMIATVDGKVYYNYLLDGQLLPWQMMDVFTGPFLNSSKPTIATWL